MAKILIVEDSPTQMEAIRRLVENLGHHVVCAEDGDVALAQAIEHQPDLVLMDVIMPKKSGFNATRDITRHPQTSHIPVAILTTKSDPTDRVWGMRQGAKAYLVKPFSDKELTDVIGQLLPAS